MTPYNPASFDSAGKELYSLNMGLPAIICIIILAASTCNAEVVISQQFDKSGRPSVSVQRNISSLADRTRRYTVSDNIGLRKDIRYEFYPVFGKTFTEIIRSSEENGPIDTVTKIKKQAVYDWSFGWKYTLDYTTETDEETGIIHCDILLKDISVNFDIVITLPALTNDSALNPVEKDMWINYLKKLVEHQHMRVKIIKDDTRDMLLKRLAGIDYLPLQSSQTDKVAYEIERFVRKETEKIATETASQIRTKLDELEGEKNKKETFPTRRR